MVSILLGVALIRKWQYRPRLARFFSLISEQEHEMAMEYFEGVYHEGDGPSLGKGGRPTAGGSFVGETHNLTMLL